MLGSAPPSELNLFVVFPLQIFSFREIEEGRCTKDPRLQLLLLQEAEPEGAAERSGHHQPAVSLTQHADTPRHTFTRSHVAPAAECFSLWFVIVRIQKRKHNRVKTWTRHVDLFQKDFIFVPINES